MPRASSSSTAACMRCRSDSEPTTMPTNGLDMGQRRDVAAITHAGERDVLAGGVGALPRSRDGKPGRRDAKNPAAVRDHLISLERRAGMEDECAAPFGVFDPLDRRAHVAPGRIFA